MLRLQGKIDAIKRVRQAAPTMEQPLLVPVEGTTHAFRLTIGGTNGMSLKEAKDLVEAIMELGVKSYLEDQLNLRISAAKMPHGGGDVWDRP